MAQQVAVPPESAAAADLAPVGYQDAFAVRPPVRRSAEEWMRLGLEGMPAPVRALVLVAHRGVLRFRLAPPGTPGHVSGWTILSNDPDRIVLGAQGPLCTARIVFSLTGGDGVLATLLRFDRPRARRLWTVLAPVHRTVASLLLDRTARGGRP